ncbi:hypothetical protein V2J09_018034 [Rumex salicifolius]
MGARKLYGSLDSAATLKVVALLFELDVEFDFIPVDVEAGENLKEPFLSMSPFGELPVYEDGPFRPFRKSFYLNSDQYGAILRCVGHQYSKKGQELICWVAKEQAIVANWVDVEDNHFRPAATKLLEESKKKPKENGAEAAAALLEAQQKMIKVFDVYESQLSKSKSTNKYLVMDKYTIVDVAHMPYLQSLMDTPDTRKLIVARPCVNAWALHILARPAWTKVLHMHTN